MRAHEFLLEYNQQLTIQNFGDKVINQFKKEGERAWGMMLMNLEQANNDPEVYDYYKTALIKELEKVDPTPHKEYVQWLARMYCNGQTKLEDVLSRGKDALARFQKLKIKKQLQPADRDINRLRTLADLESLIERYPDVDDAATNKGAAKEFYRDAEIRIVMPMDEAAACYYGQGTRWCTAARENNMFNRYNEYGQLYIIFPMKPAYNGEKYQIHFESSSFMNEKDDPVSPDKLVARWPQLRKIFYNIAKQTNAISFLLTPQDVESKYDDIMNHVSNMMYDAGQSVKQELISEYRNILRSNRNVYNQFNIMFSDDDDRYDEALMDMTMAFIGDFLSLSTSALSEESDELQNWLMDETAALSYIVEFIAGNSGNQSEDVEMDVHYNMVAGFYSSIKEQLPAIIKTIWPNL